MRRIGILFILFYFFILKFSFSQCNSGETEVNFVVHSTFYNQWVVINDPWGSTFAWWNPSPGPQQYWVNDVSCYQQGCYTVYFGGGSPEIYVYQDGMLVDSITVSGQQMCIPYTLGCTDSLALNYDSNASLDDGSCNYQMTYVPDDNFESYFKDTL